MSLLAPIPIFLPLFASSFFRDYCCFSDITSFFRLPHAASSKKNSSIHLRNGGDEGTQEQQPLHFRGGVLHIPLWSLHVQ